MISAKKYLLGACKSEKEERNCADEFAYNSDGMSTGCGRKRTEESAHGFVYRETFWRSSVHGGGCRDEVEVAQNGLEMQESWVHNVRDIKQWRHLVKKERLAFSILLTFVLSGKHESEDFPEIY